MSRAIFRGFEDSRVRFSDEVDGWIHSVAAFGGVGLLDAARWMVGWLDGWMKLFVGIRFLNEVDWLVFWALASLNPLVGLNNNLE